MAKLIPENFKTLINKQQKIPAFHKTLRCSWLQLNLRENSKDLSKQSTRLSNCSFFKCKYIPYWSWKKISPPNFLFESEVGIGDERAFKIKIHSVFKNRFRSFLELFFLFNFICLNFSRLWLVWKLLFGFQTFALICIVNKRNV